MPRANQDGSKAEMPAAPVMVLSWLIPGYGFFVHGLRSRALLVFGLLQSTFLIGALLRGSVLLPDVKGGGDGFNLVALLTFATQMFNGGLGLVSLIPDVLGARFAILPYNEASNYADLGSFYLLVSGGLNWFVLMSTYDHFYGTKRGRALEVAGVVNDPDKAVKASPEANS